uniref:Ankyrin repeat protein n=1 Tax=Marseillevirus LCMAC101 TaxID=2506602 RepID=A0A481YRI5_9VIRU|nr:MAG: ankyrin repeat protein [Marseillevirus LCMAC101]
MTSKLNEKLCEECWGANLEKTVECLDQGADPNLMDNWGFTPLMLAAEACSFPIVKILVDRGAEINFYSESRGRSALLSAVITMDGLSDIVKFLIDEGADIYVTDKEGKSIWDFTPGEEYKEELREYISKVSFVEESD